MERQMEVQAQIAKFLENFRKIGRKNYTPARVRSRIKSLKELWLLFTDGNAELKRIVPEATKVTTNYFSKGLFEETEEAYHAALDYMAEILEELEPPPSPHRSADLSFYGATPSSLALSHLPSVPLPPFEGKVADWESFRDRFTSLIINNKDLNDFTRLHFLVSSLRGIALECVSDLAIIAENFSVAWQALRDRFDNRRRLLSAHMNNLFNLPRLSRECLHDLQSLRGQAKKAIASLKKLQPDPIELLNTLFVHVISQNLDPATLKAWTLRVPDNNEPTSFDMFDQFLATRIRALEDFSSRSVDRPAKKSPGSSSVHSAVASTSSKSVCPICGAPHFFSACKTFLRGNPSQRRELVKRHNRCFNCLSKNHSANECTSKFSCRTCHRKHHSLLHSGSDSELPVKTELSSTHTPACARDAPLDVHSALAATGAARGVPVLLATARISVRSSCGRVAVVRVLLDQGSEMTLVSERLAQVLRAKRIRMPLSITAIGCVNAGTFQHAVELRVSPLSSSSLTFATTAVVLKSLTTYTPRSTIESGSLAHLSGLSWADPNPLNNDPIELIIGADLYGEILRDCVRRGAAGQPVAQETVFGWIISGPVGRVGSSESSRVPAVSQPSSDSVSVSHCITSPSLEEAIQRFWELESIPSPSIRSPDDERCEDHFKTTHSRLPDGRYRVRLPFKEKPPIEIGASRFRAERSFGSMTRRLRDRPQLWKAYCTFLQEYEKLGHMRRVPEAENSNTPIVFIPHHPVLRAHSLTTRLRVVFNASSPTSDGSSLNDHLLAGPKLQTELPAVILRWRQFRYVYCADIEKMYRQILVDDRDLDFQRILWSESTSGKPLEFQLLTVTYGMACAPFLALRVIKQLMTDEGINFPLAAPILKNNIYVDDLLFGSDSVEESHRIRDQVISLLGRGGFTLKKWSGNSPTLLQDMADEGSALACSKTLAADEQVKILGVAWIPSDDVFSIQVSMPDKIPRSKRSILSTIAKLYDPLGWVTPVIITAKIFIQMLWQHALSWDEAISNELFTRWRQIYMSLPALDGLHVSRWTGFSSDVKGIELHGFADASNAAYAAVVYCKIISRSDHVNITLLAGKSKVAPLKPLSVPRLELSAAVILSRLIEFVRSALVLENAPCYCWSDSTVVLTWLSNHPSKWKVFVANRVSDIQSRLPSVHWRYVPTNENPADCASRGLLGDELRDKTLWWLGPPWLAQSEEGWPSAFAPRTEGTALEEKRVTLHTVTPPRNWDLFMRISRWPKLIRVTAYVFRFISACRRKQLESSRSPNLGRSLTADEYCHARTFWIKWLQSTLFHAEIETLANRQPLPPKSSILSLSPFLDKNGVLRVGGRISRAPLPFPRRHPILLASHRLTTMIIDHAHHRALHAGTQLTLNVLRQEFWVIRARGLIRNIIYHCVACARERAAMPTQLMSDLPRERVTAPLRSFLNCGLDYAGPVQVRASAGRGVASRKAYIALFICLATRAVHLELVSDYSAQTFLNAFSRFSARRGLPKIMYSDNGTNFIGAEKELAAAYRSALLDPNFLNLTATDGIEWKFIPPSAPHFGGIWEAGVKSVKHHMRRVIKDHTLTVEEMSTLLCRIEACLNSRPLAPLSDSPEDYEPLTPGHFLIGSAIMTHPEPSLLDIKEGRLTRWQLVRQMTERFWHLWYADYINSLQQRSKWRRIQPPLKIGQLVLIRNANLPPCKWELGRVIRCHPGADGLIRVVTLRTASSELTRPITKLCLLPIDCSESSVP